MDTCEIHILVRLQIEFSISRSRFHFMHWIRCATGQESRDLRPRPQARNGESCDSPMKKQIVCFLSRAAVNFANEWKSATSNSKEGKLQHLKT